MQPGAPPSAAGVEEAMESGGPPPAAPQRAPPLMRRELCPSPPRKLHPPQRLVARAPLPSRSDAPLVMAGNGGHCGRPSRLPGRSHRHRWGGGACGCGPMEMAIKWKAQLGQHAQERGAARFIRWMLCPYRTVDNASDRWIRRP
ncbi:hypothetical protein PVAP13_2NG339603 [Panicum virgatum]|uniref:Uncharacterized protein n=1 Tax=Panicum virgatum TaxID=38727 RepID=A0A8T0VK95_PANVG|nr:hypothetical protein PVAP13_2NG339603 [Panicum virgatum]